MTGGHGPNRPYCSTGLHLCIFKMGPLLFVLPIPTSAMRTLTQPPSASRSTPKSASLVLNRSACWSLSSSGGGTAISPTLPSNTSAKHLMALMVSLWWHYQQMLNTARPFATQQQYAISVRNPFIQGLSCTLLPAFCCFYLQHSTIHNLSGSGYQRQMLLIILAAAQAPRMSISTFGMLIAACSQVRASLLMVPAAVAPMQARPKNSLLGTRTVHDMSAPSSATGGAKAITPGWNRGRSFVPGVLSPRSSRMQRSNMLLIKTISQSAGSSLEAKARGLSNTRTLMRSPRRRCGRQCWPSIPAQHCLSWLSASPPPKLAQLSSCSMSPCLTWHHLLHYSGTHLGWIPTHHAPVGLCLRQQELPRYLMCCGHCHRSNHHQSSLFYRNCNSVPSHCCINP